MLKSGQLATTVIARPAKSVNVSLTHQGALIEKNTQNGETRVRAHLPRWDYRLEPADARSGVANHHYPVQHHGGDEGLGVEHLLRNGIRPRVEQHER
jgi:hypothetical protein